MRLVLDMHAALWLTISPDKLGAVARLAVEGSLVVISDVTLSEVARLICAPKKGLYVSARRAEWLEAFASCFTVVPVSARIADRAAGYTFDDRDPCDRHILATADVLGLPLVTIDGPVTACAASVGVGVIW